MDILTLTPHVVNKIWGGQNFEQFQSGQQELPVGELWVVSTLAEGYSCPSQAASLKLPFELSYLIKFIDTQDNLSIQVHPNDDYAKMHEAGSGKTECWVILAAQEQAGIYLGLKPGVDHGRLNQAVREGRDVSQLLNFYPVKRGDFFYVPAGAIHAIGKGITLAEIQQSSGITYRLWDWNRTEPNGKPRTLHIDKAFDVVNFDEKANLKAHFLPQYNLFSLTQTKVCPIQHPDFKVEVINLSKGASLPLSYSAKRPASIVCIEGVIRVHNNNRNNVELKTYEAAVIFDQPDHHGLEVVAQKDCHFIYVS